jgi:serine/threonine protein kinase
MGPRHLALHELDHTSHVIHRPSGRDRFEQRRFLAIAQAAQRLNHPHILPIEDFGLDARGYPWLVTPFTGDATGLWSLEAHLRAKGGYLSPLEARQAVMHLCEASAHAHAAGAAHGPLVMDEVHVDRRGSLLIEFYGLSRMRRTGETLLTDPALRQAEVRSIVRIGYQLVTGLLPEAPIIAASRVVSGLDPAWDAWFETGLGDTGFKSAAHAASALSDSTASTRTVAGGAVRSAIRRLLYAGV